MDSEALQPCFSASKVGAQLQIAKHKAADGPRCCERCAWPGLRQLKFLKNGAKGSIYVYIYIWSPPPMIHTCVSSSSPCPIKGVIKACGN